MRIRPYRTTTVRLRSPQAVRRCSGRVGLVRRDFMCNLIIGAFRQEFNSMQQQTVQSALEQAFALYSQRKLHEAEIIGRQILQSDPRNVPAMNLLGVIAHDVGRNDISIEWLKRAIAIQPESPGVWNNLG